MIAGSGEMGCLWWREEKDVAAMGASDEAERTRSGRGKEAKRLQVAITLGEEGDCSSRGEERRSSARREGKLHRRRCRESIARMKKNKRQRTGEGVGGRGEQADCRCLGNSGLGWL